ncbi:MAG TPA: hypothetical protein V6D28_10275 [Leptolyngbyaceae cyanobacterium]
MSKLLLAISISIAILIASTQRPIFTLAGTCAGASCPPPPLGFIPGQRVNFHVVNRTASIVLVEKVEGTDAFPLRPGQELRFERWTGTEPNLSVVFWDATALSLQARVSKPDEDTLRVELRPGSRPPGDRTIYILNDGRVAVF